LLSIIVLALASLGCASHDHTAQAKAACCSSGDKTCCDAKHGSDCCLVDQSGAKQHESPLIHH
jgi:hypothetical protein